MRNWEVYYVLVSIQRLTAARTETILSMQAKFIIILFIVFARDKKREINLLQKLHFKIIQFFDWDSSNESIRCAVIERIIVKLNSQYDTDNDDTMD